MMWKKVFFLGILSITCSGGLLWAQQAKSKKELPKVEQFKYILYTTSDSNQKQLHIDSVVMNEAAMIDAELFEEGKHPSPSFMWYQNNFNDKKVKLSNNTLDSLPDEISVLLVKRGESPFVFPVKNMKTSDYGWRWNRPHRGVDIKLNTGDSVLCSFDGVVRVAKPLGNYGNLVVVRHYNGLETVYAHLSKINVKPLQIVKAGHLVGLGGSTGRSTGPHLHFECRFQYEAFDPEWILDFETKKLRTNRLYLDKTYFGMEPPSRKTKNYYTFSSDANESKEVNILLSPKYHIVGKGETLNVISNRYSVPVDELKDLNNLKTENLKNKQKIRIQ